MSTDNKSILAAELRQVVQTIKGAILGSQARTAQMIGELPSLREFSNRNLKNMRTFFEEWYMIELSNSAVMTAELSTDTPKLAVAIIEWNKDVRRL